MEKTKKHSRHSFRSNTLPAVVMTGPMTLLLLLLGGDKTTQLLDIRKARKLLREWKRNYEN